MLTLPECVTVIDLEAKWKSARAIVLSLGVGKTQIQGVFAKKTLILPSWKAGTNGKLQSLAARKEDGKAGRKRKGDKFNVTSIVNSLLHN